MTRSIIFDINFLQSSQHIAPYFRGCLRVVIELHTTHTRDFVKIADDRFEDEELGELSLRENGLLIRFESLSCDPNILKFVESCNTGFLRIDVERLFESLLSVESTDNAGAVVDDIDVDGESFDGSLAFVDLSSNSSTKLKPRI